jgi:hypothetical protein
VGGAYGSQMELFETYRYVRRWGDVGSHLKRM